MEAVENKGENQEETVTIERSPPVLGEGSSGIKGESTTQEQTDTRAIETRPNGDDRPQMEGEPRPDHEPPAKRKRGGQPGNQSGLRHGLYALQASKARRLRHRAQKIRAEIRDSLITDLGGEQNVSAQQRVLVEFVAHDVASFDQINRAITRILKKRPAIKENPASMSKLDSYLRPMMNSAASNVFKLGLEKRVKVKTLAEVLAEDYSGDGEDEQGDGGEGQDEGGGEQGGGDPGGAEREGGS